MVSLKIHTSEMRNFPQLETIKRQWREIATPRMEINMNFVFGTATWLSDSICNPVTNIILKRGHVLWAGVISKSAYNKMLLPRSVTEAIDIDQ